MSNPYGWNLDDPEEYDLCTKINGSYYDVIHSVNGWRVSTPFHNWAFVKEQWVKDWNLQFQSTATREQARIFVEKLIEEELPVFVQKHT